MTESHSQINQRSDEELSDTGSIDHQKARRGIQMILEAIGEDPETETLTETWQRRVPQALETLTEGTREGEKPTLRTFDAENDELVVKTGIPLYSLCEHHLLPYHGVAHVAYRPGDNVVGLSKLPRYVRWQSRRLTMQEELTRDIAHGLHTEIEAEGVLVEITATHLCEAMRGVETATETTTLSTAGEPTEQDKKRLQRAIHKS